jgi:hypothetical protein
MVQTYAIRLFGLVALIHAGCSDSPKAPALRQHESEYVNEREGVRFTKPEGWLEQGRSDLPPGPVAVERLLIKYKRPEKQDRDSAFIKLTLIDVPSDQTPEDFLNKRKPPEPNWLRKSSLEPVRLGALGGWRLIYGGLWDDGPYRADVVAFRKGVRVFVFTAFYPENDEAGQGQLRRAMESLRTIE